ncbi:MAG: glycine cleavage system protein H [Vitreoscilla sp.]|nr:glycine cleavage system protein H [Burkholderiales bacterium]MBP6338919.1 glycine cleavage system protein H [Vitreoscilla sp.]MBP6676993.1 glycine cleavage system protein H [Vitreoscilla sp.]
MSATAHFPAELHYDVAHQTWARPEADGSVTVGITALGIRLSGEIYMCRPKPVGQTVERGRSVAVVELAKSIVSVKSPVGGEVLAVNEGLANEPERVHLDPYGSGWIARLAPSNWAADQALLRHGEAAVAQAMAHHAWLHRAELDDGERGTP